MPYIEAQNGGGGSMSETVLWSNSNTSVDFGQTPLNNLDFSGYEVIRFYWKNQKTQNDDTDSVYSDYLKTDWDNMGELTKPLVALGGTSSSASYVRVIYKTSSTGFTIYPAYRLNASGTANQYVIPIKICGLK